MRSSADVQRAYFWEKGILLIGPFLSVILYHFATQFAFSKLKRRTLIILYTICFLFIPLEAADLVFTGMQIAAYGYAPILGPLAPLWMLYIYTILILAFFRFISVWRNSTNAGQRNRAAYIAGGIGIGLIGGIFDFLPALGLPLYPGAIISILIECVLITIAILKHNLLDIHIVFRKSTVYILTSALIGVPLVAATLFIVDVSVPVSSQTCRYIAIAVVIGLLLPYLWGKVQQLIDRWFYRDRYNYLKTLEAFNQQAQSLNNSDSLVDMIANLIAKTFRLSSVYILQPELSSDEFVVVAANAVNKAAHDIHIRKESMLLKWLERSGEMLACEDLDAIPQLQGMIHNEKRALQCAEMDLLISIRSSTGCLIGIMILGKKLSEQPYTLEERQIAYAISGQVAAKLDNIRLYNNTLRERRNFEMWLNSMTDCVMIINQEYSVQFVNEAVVRTFGAEYHSTCWSILGKDSPCLSCPLKSSTNNYENVLRFTNNIKGRLYDVVITHTLIPSGNPSVIIILRDVTNRELMIKKLRDSREQLRKTGKDLEAAREQERRNVAIQLHDEIGQRLTAVQMGLSWLIKKIPNEQESLIQKTKSALEITNEIDQKVRSVEMNLRPSLLDDLGLEATIRWQAEQFRKQTEIVCELHVDFRDSSLDIGRSTLLFRVLQESLNNVARHANATRVRVSLQERDGRLVMKVKDNGKGIAQGQIYSTKSIGLAGIRERVGFLGGEINIRGVPNKGTTLTVRVPINGEVFNNDKSTRR